MISRVVVLGLVMVCSSAGAETPVRTERPLSLGAFAAWPKAMDHDVTGPVPGVRLGVNVLPRLSLDLALGTLSYSEHGGWSLVDVGARWHLTDAGLSPYLMARAGYYFVDGDETPNRTYPFGTIGGGVEYACTCGFVTWAEVGPAFLRSDSFSPGPTALGFYTSLGFGYRVFLGNRSTPTQP